MERARLQQICQRHNALLLEVDARRVAIAVVGSPPAQLLETLRFSTGKSLDIRHWSASQWEKYQQGQAANLQEAPDHSPSTVSLVDQLLQQALCQRASDIHIEPGEPHCRIRLRIDGVLHPLAQPIDDINALIARLKVLANLDIAERRLPQDGQFSLDLPGQRVSFRLSTLPCHLGEKAVLRLLEQQKPRDIQTLGMTDHQQQQFRHALAKSQGLILVTGPTGSGKTSTLYSALSHLNRPQVNICSVEDPIEIPQPGLTQTQINPKAGLTFQTVLRALLRQDPDIIMIGEIRDLETAEIALKAAQTGHLVLSTLHTSTTLQTLTRLEQMGVPRWLTASALELIIAQRLVRRLCPHCRTPASPPAPGWQAPGCEQCHGGYYGRLALFELLPIREQHKTQIASGQPLTSPPVTLANQAQQAITSGLTSWQELNGLPGVNHEPHTHPVA